MKVHEFMHEMRTTSAILGRTSGISVVFEGDQASTNGKIITLPSLPSEMDLSQEQVMAMRGFVDHEAGHNRHTDMSRVLSFYDKNGSNGRKNLSGLHNALEDVWMEDRVIDEYPGAWKNLRQCHELTRSNEVKRVEEIGGPEAAREFFKDKPIERASSTIVLEGNPEFNTESVQQMKEVFSEESLTMGRHYAKLALACQDSSEVIELAKKIYQYENETPPEDQTPEDFDKKAEAGELSDLEGEGNEGKNSPDFQEGNPVGKEGEEDKEGEGNPIGSQELKDTLTSGDEASGGIGRCVDEGLRGGYVVASTAYDKTYKRGLPRTTGMTESNYEVVNDKDHWSAYDNRKSELRSEVMVMKSKLRRALMARQQRDWDFGRETGRLDSKRLVAASQGVRQVWKRRTDREDYDTAITILIDLSGSMHGRKVEVARDCAIALSECFEGTGMSYRISGFSNNGSSPVDYYDRGRPMAHRFERTDWTIFKDFDDPLRTTRGSVHQITQAVGGNNSDWDFVNYELNDLTTRPEVRKVLFVLSDGRVACTSSAPTEEHERLIRENLKFFKAKSGVESVGIGICDDGVTKIYPDHVVVNNVADLSSKVFSKLTEFLFRDKK